MGVELGSSAVIARLARCCRRDAGRADPDDSLIGLYVDPESSFVKAVPKALLGFWVPAL